jgi:hypothetical protein
MVALFFVVMVSLLPSGHRLEAHIFNFFRKRRQTLPELKMSGGGGDPKGFCMSQSENS